MIKPIPQNETLGIINKQSFFSKHTLTGFILFLFMCVAPSVFAQGGTCAEIEPFCAGNEAFIFANCNSSDPNCVATAEPGPDYGCLLSQPYPAWFYLQIDEPGSLDFEIVQNTAFDANGNPIGTGLDVDFIAWGPFQQGDDLCDYTQLQSFNEIGCSFSAQPIENFSIPNAQAGDIYVLVITNYNQSAGFIKLGQTGGTGSTNCDIVLECSVTIDGGDQSYCDVDEVVLTTSTTGPVETYQWYLNDTVLTGETNETLTVTETGDYKVIIDGTDCDTTEEDEVTITFLGLPCNTAVCTTIDFEENFGTGTERVCLDPNVSTSTYTCNDTSQVEDGQYSIYYTSTGLNTGWHVGMEDHTEGDTNGRMLFVNAAFDPGEFYRRTIVLSENNDFAFNAWITTVYDTDTNICGGNSIPANVIFRIEDINGGLIAETNTGDIPNGPEPNWQQFTIAFNTGANTEVQLVLINNSIGGCGNDLAIDDITLTKEGNPPTVETPPDLTECNASGNGTAIFDLESQIPVILNGQDPADFNVTFHLGQGAAELNIDAIATPGAYENTSNPETIYVRIEKATEPTCFNTVSFDLNIATELVLTTDLPETAELCATDPFPALDATPTNPGIDVSQATYVWTDASGTTVSTDAIYTPTAAGIYTVVVSYLPGCSEETFTVEVIVYEPATVDLGADQVICEGTIFEIVPTITGDTTGITYLWSPGGETTPTITVTEAGTYTLEITTNGLCSTSDSVLINVTESPIITLGDELETCFEEATILDASPSNYDPATATYEWMLDGVVIPSETNATINAALYGYGTYSVIVTAESCTGEGAITIMPRSDLAVTLGDSFNTCPDEAQTITATTDEEGVTYEWLLNGTPIDNETNSTLTIEIPAGTIGSQTYTVIITKGECSGTASIDVTLYDIDNCTISQGISPNNDGYNDSLDLTFLQERVGIDKLQIFNRHGVLVFEQNNYTNEWVGQTNEGDELPTGTYYYVIDLLGNDAVYGQQATGFIYINKETK